MSSRATTALPAPQGIPTRAIGNAAIAVLVFLSGFVMVEPAPSDLLLCVVAIIWASCGLTFTRSMLPLIVLLALYCAGGLLSFTQLQAFQKPITYMATTIFLAISSIFFCAVLQTDTARRMRIIEKSYLAAAVLCAMLGILGYFGAIPHADLFTLYERAKGAFKDPNVFGPFVVLPLVVLARSILTQPIHRSGWAILAAMILVLGLFLSFSRAAWGLAVLAMLVMTLLVFATEPRTSKRLRMSAALVAVLLGLVILLAVAISIPAVQELVIQRVKLVQDYDASRLGRFERHIIGFFLIQEHPFGVGPFQFGLSLGEDEHNMWLKGFTVYGWLGGFSYIALVIWTLVIATPLVVRKRPWTPFLQCVYAVYVGHLMIHNVIDNDHWRHLFLIYGLLWGAYAVERSPVRHRVRRGTVALPLSLAESPPSRLVFGPVALPRAR
ncbi:MAG TPA: O-antigen ligase family protein [Kaistia sp.]|nr:O-antigen ligase family protein [Kaistia sp.]